MKRKICVFTGTRADYSRLYSVMVAIEKNEALELSLIVSGMHLIEKHGQTVNQIKSDGFIVDREVYSLIEGETLETMTKSVGLTITEMATALHHIKPHILLLHGDRFEVFGAAVAASMMNIPVAHIQGGEITASVDESLRHAITKLSHLHFPSNENARQRIIKLGEIPDYVFSVGCPMVDKMLKVEKIDKNEIFKSNLVSSDKDNIKYNPNDPFILIIFHPVTSDVDKMFDYTITLLTAIQKLDMQAFWLWPNADAGARDIVKGIKTFNNFFWTNTKIGFYRNFPIDLFINILDHTSCVVGNSSVGMREACYFGTPVVNIGNRQSGRIRSKNIIDVEVDEDQIYQAIRKQCEHGKYEIERIYGDGNSGEKIAEILADIDIPNTQKQLCY